MICINCRGATTPFSEKKGFVIERCAGCGLMAVKNVPEDLTPYYAEGYFTGDVSLDGYMDYDLDKEVSKKTYNHYLDIIARYVGERMPIRMFEVGAATGFFMALAEERGWKTAGIDISDYAVKKAQARGLTMMTATLETMVTSETFDAVVLQDVIEHVKDPVGTITRVKQLLDVNGIVVLTTPDAASLWARLWGSHWHAFVPPQHLFYFSAKNLASVLEAQGFKVLYSGHHGKWFTVPYIIRLLYSWTNIRLFSTLAEWTSRSFLKKVALPINVRDTLFLVVKKI